MLLSVLLPARKPFTPLRFAYFDLTNASIRELTVLTPGDLHRELVAILEGLK